jgi:hypothetical protein
MYVIYNIKKDNLIYIAVLRGTMSIPVLPLYNLHKKIEKYINKSKTYLLPHQKLYNKQVL